MLFLATLFLLLASSAFSHSPPMVPSGLRSRQSNDSDSDSFPPIVITDPVGVVQCVPYLLSWTGGYPPYIVLVQLADTLGDEMFSAEGINSTNVTWTWAASAGATPDISMPFTVSVMGTYPNGSLGIPSFSKQEEITVGSPAIAVVDGDCTNITSSSSAFSTQTVANTALTRSTPVLTTIVPSAASAGIVPSASSAAMPLMHSSYMALFVWISVLCAL
ncbi:Apoptosis-inducing factor [Mycena chlorophos]|uniref:Apoptosis-inducing factor n=1 Tax=Mycena chlorophos TaxID=658473 RepID=A0A8H6SKB8_MYCCL|nr:Apoptosis-inducing factor [Mycena chlorophos]